MRHNLIQLWGINNTLRRLATLFSALFKDKTRNYNNDVDTIITLDQNQTDRTNRIDHFLENRNYAKTGRSKRALLQRHRPAGQYVQPGRERVPTSRNVPLRVG